jgi:hypothetical protein
MQTFLFEHQRDESPLSPFTNQGGYPVNSRTVKQLSYQGSVTWMEALGDFLDFLTAVYGFDIKSQVHIGEPVQLTDLITEYYQDIL